MLRSLERTAPIEGAFTVTGKGLRVRLHVTPRAAIERVGDVAAAGAAGWRLKIAVSAPPHDGKANEAVIKLLAREWRIPKTSLSVVSGGGGRAKVIALSGDADLLTARLRAWSAGRGNGSGSGGGR